jgi:thiol-disulfide isomerase/thioredoxin
VICVSPHWSPPYIVLLSYRNFKSANADKLVFLKFSSPICAACRMLKQKFQTLHRNPKFAGAPVVFADIVISNNKRVQDPFRDYITSQLQVRRIPTIHFYAGGSDAHVDEIYCDDEGGCSWPKIQQQMLDFVGQQYTPPPPTTTTAHDMSSTVNAAAAIIQPSATAMATARVATQKISKRQRIRRLLSLHWLW